jgi:hypothetical protein
MHNKHHVIYVAFSGKFAKAVPISENGDPKAAAVLEPV